MTSSMTNSFVNYAPPTSKEKYSTSTNRGVPLFLAQHPRTRTTILDQHLFIPQTKESTSTNGVKRICGSVNVVSSTTYCPIRTIPGFAENFEAKISAVCPNIAALRQEVQQQVGVINQQIGSDAVDMFGNKIVEAFTSNAFGTGLTMVADVETYMKTVTDTLGGVSNATARLGFSSYHPEVVRVYNLNPSSLSICEA